MKMINSFVMYAISSGLNRGAVFLIMPILAFTLKADDYGALSLFFVSSQLLVPFITLNFSSVIARDVYEKKYSVTSSLLKINSIIIPVFIISIIVYIALGNTYFSYISFALIESFFIINSTYLRYVHGANEFARITFFKFSLLLFVLVGGYFIDVRLLASFNFIIITFIVSSSVSIIYFWRFFYLLNPIKSVNYLLRKKELLLFGVFLLPHVFSQWAISGLDKYVIKLYLDSNILGVYAFGYSISSLYMLVNSALALFIPQICVKSNDKFQSDKFYRTYFISISAVFAIFLILGVVFFYYYSGQFSDSDVFLDVFVPVSLGLYILSFYYYYNSVVFYQRGIRFINNSTFFVGLVTAGGLLVLVPIWGIVSASWITMASYVLYFILYSWRSRYLGLWRIILPLIMLAIYYSLLLCVDFFIFSKG